MTQQSPETIARWRAAILRGLDQMWGYLKGLPGDLTMGHIACAAALGYLDLRHGALEWRKGRGELAAWFDEFNARPSMRETDPA
ncbi:MAG: glutathione S-transferase C-terminal domain-containing protein [Kiloniellaceae bacterium]